MSGQRVLIIGAGFLGRAIGLRLIAAGDSVTVLSPRADTNDWPAGAALVLGLQEDAALIGGLLAEHDLVIHTAWGTTPSSSAGHPVWEAERGLNPFLAFLDMLQRFPRMRLLFLSSGGTVYGDPVHLPVAEDAPLRPRSCHGAGKAAAELFLGLRRPDRTIVLRPSNIYGPRQPLRSGFGVIRHLLACAANDRPFQLWGDGSQVRDYLFIEDFVEAVFRLVLHPTAVGVFNLGSGRGISLRELIDLVGKVVGRPIRVEEGPARDEDVRKIVLDISRLRQAVMWQPAVTMEDGLVRTWLQTGN